MLTSVGLVLMTSLGWNFFFSTTVVFLTTSLVILEACLEGDDGPVSENLLITFCLKEGIFDCSFAFGLIRVELEMPLITALLEPYMNKICFAVMYGMPVA